MKKSLLVTFASAALSFSSLTAFADHAPVTDAPKTPYSSKLTVTKNIKTVKSDFIAHSFIPTDIVVLNFTGADYEVQVDHPPVINDILPPNGYDRIINNQWAGMTDLHIYLHGMKIFDDLVGNHAIVAIYPDGVDVDNHSV